MKDDELANKTVRELMLYAWEQAAKNDYYKTFKNDYYKTFQNPACENFNADMVEMKTFLGKLRLHITGKSLVWGIPFTGNTCKIELTDELTDTLVKQLEGKI